MPSEHSRLIQAADLVTFLHHRRPTIVETSPKQEKAVLKIWGHMEGRIAHQFPTCP